MRTLNQIRTEIENTQAEYRRIRRLNIGVIRGAIDTGDPTEKIVMESAEVKIGGNNGQKYDAEQPSGNLQPPSAADPQK